MSRRLRETAEDVSTLDRLRRILNTRLTDEDIIGGVSLTQAGMHKVAGSLGIAASDLPTLLNSLRSKIKREQGETASRPLAEAEERFTIEPDLMGNVTIRDTVSGREVMLRGQDAAEARADYKRGGSAALASHMGLRETVLAGHLRETELDFAEEIANTHRGGTFNFPWRLDGQHGFGTARFDASGHVSRLLYVADSSGEEMTLDETMMAKVAKAAQDFIGRE